MASDRELDKLVAVITERVRVELGRGAAAPATS